MRDQSENSWPIGPYEDDERAESPTWLYRYYDPNFTLVYIGISNQPQSRNDAHKCKPWYRFAGLVMLECFPLRDLAEAAEEYAIVREEPIANLRIRPAPHIGPRRAPWFFEASGNLLRGIDRHWANPRVCMNTRIDCPEGFVAPDDIVPEFIVL